MDLERLPILAAVRVIALGRDVILAACSVFAKHRKNHSPSMNPIRETMHIIHVARRTRLLAQPRLTSTNTAGA